LEPLLVILIMIEKIQKQEKSLRKEKQNQF
jgi:hypothetical protein